MKMASRHYAVCYSKKNRFIREQEVKELSSSL